MVCSIAFSAWGGRAHTHRAASVKSVQFVRKKATHGICEKIACTRGIRVPLSLRSYMSFMLFCLKLHCAAILSILLFCLKESRAVSHDTARAKRDIIKT